MRISGSKRVDKVGRLIDTIAKVVLLILVLLMILSVSSIPQEGPSLLMKLPLVEALRARGVLRNPSSCKVPSIDDDDYIFNHVYSRVMA
jgi:hypothetical protein